MAKIREDLVGAVHVDGSVLFAGDEVPQGVKIGPHLIAEEAAETGEGANEEVSQEVSSELEAENDSVAEEAAEEKPKRGRPRKKAEPNAGAPDAAVD